MAALAVLVFHFTAAFRPAALPTSYLAVDLFFVLSGFVLTYAYQDKLGRSLTATDFMIARVIRLYPLYLLGFIWGAALIVGLQIHSPHPSFPVNVSLALGFNLFGLPSPYLLVGGSSWLYQGNTPAWSLFYELVINLAFGLTARRLTDRRLIAIMIVAAIVLVAACWQRRDFSVGPDWYSVPGALARVTFSFSAGVLAYRRWDKHRPRGLPVWVAALALLIIFAIPANGMARLALNCVAVLVVFPQLIYRTASAKPGRFAGVCSTLGVASYAVYVLHWPAYLTFGYLWSFLAHGRPIEMAAPYLGVAFLVAMLFGCIAVDKVYDAPVRAFLTRRHRAFRQRRIAQP